MTRPGAIFDEPAVVRRLERRGALARVTGSGTVAAAVMVGAALLALLVANSPLYEGVEYMLGLPLTVGMNVASLVLTLLIAVPVGVFSAVRRNSFADRVLTVLVFIGFAMPSFWLALILMMFFGIELGWLPMSGITSFGFEALGPLEKAIDIAKHLAMPVAVYTLGSLAGMSRYMRACMLEVMEQDYMLTARAKGLPASVVLWRHGLRNALLPLITLLGLSVPGLIGGSVIIESIFALPGRGLQDLSRQERQRTGQGQSAPGFQRRFCGDSDLQYRPDPAPHPGSPAHL